jgi:O-antigen ligase
MYSTREIFFFNKIPFCLTVLMPIFLVTGPFLPDLAISICSALFLINSYKNKLINYYKNNFFIVFFFFYIYLNVSALLSSNIIFSLETSLPYIRYGIFSLSTWYLLNNDEGKLLKYFFYSFLCVFSILIIDGIYQAFNKYNLFNYPLLNNRVSSFFGDELILGSFLSRNYSFFIGSFLFLLNLCKISKKIIYLTYTVLVFIPVLVFLSGERSSFFYTIIAMICIILFSSKYIKFFLLISTFLISIISFNNYGNFANRIFGETKIQLTTNTQEGKRLNIFSKVHEDHYKSAIKIFKDHPITGAGPRSFRIKCVEDKYIISNQSCITHPHNTYVQLLSETGIIGFLYIFIIFFILCFYFFKIIYEKYLLNHEINIFKVCLLMSFVITLWPVIPSGNFFSNWLNVIYYLPVGFFIWIYKKEQKTKI